ncbi:transcriptional regulator [Bradyrhizobium sp. CCBAU 051011]|jgi:ArsR family transcriptional regulator, virulence genes transcriptional regulator|uniref:ArsR/SmtB family transcription factor n=1 Tax=Bradyrhizobium sp. CCBAU 051011 TaxID=858422 RepID=UPI0013743E4D|nr:metalloregulator ArsR/SmtB family transcription factor [Bradyrhizobium sp. CCBAU 051011]QHO72704.1 transcriptional regulator [Bradyrhizobium sp. CCBAU 051011]
MRAAATAAQETEQATEQETAFAPGADDAAALKKLAKQAGEAAQLLKMLANEKRLLILCFLAVRGEMTVGELVGVVKLSQSALSQHLAKLRADGLVEFRRTSQTLHYRVADQRALRVLGVLKEIFCGDLK